MRSGAFAGDSRGDSSLWRPTDVASPREPISAKLMASLIAAAGADHAIAIHFHSDQTQGFFPFPMDNLKTKRLFADYLKKKKLKNAVIVAPDAGAAKEAGLAALNTVAI
jgi:ribose-phosphate pyrophosphokinase